MGKSSQVRLRILCLLQASVWMSFFLLLLLTLVYGVRVFIFFHRLKLARRSPDRQPLLMKTGLEESHTNPI